MINKLLIRRQAPVPQVPPNSPPLAVELAVGSLQKFWEIGIPNRIRTEAYVALGKPRAVARSLSKSWSSGGRRIVSRAPRATGSGVSNAIGCRVLADCSISVIMRLSSADSDNSS